MIRQAVLMFDASLYERASRVVEDGLYDQIEAVVDYYIEGEAGVAILAYREGRDDPSALKGAFTERVGPCEVLSTDMPYVPDGLPCEQARALHQDAQHLMMRERLGMTDEDEVEGFRLRQAHAAEHAEAVMSESIEIMRQYIDLDEGEEDTWH